MTKGKAALLLAMLSLSACEQAEPDQGGQQVDPQSPLEITARERGVVRAAAATPVGVFERAHELGRDALCVVPDGPQRWRFAVTAAFGTNLSCVAEGIMTREGAGWHLRFPAVPGCETVATEQDDELQLPGRMAPECDRLCPARASLSGLRLPRASWSEDDARGLRIVDRSGRAQRLCDS